MTDTERERINAICEVAGIKEIDMVANKSGHLGLDCSYNLWCMHHLDVIVGAVRKNENRLDRC